MTAEENSLLNVNNDGISLNRCFFGLAGNSKVTPSLLASHIAFLGLPSS